MSPLDNKWPECEIESLESTHGQIRVLHHQYRVKLIHYFINDVKCYRNENRKLDENLTDKIRFL